MGGHFANECRKPKAEKSDRKFEPVDYKKKYFDLLKQKGRAFITQDYDWAEDGNDLEEDTEFVNLARMADSSEQEASSSSNQVITTNLSKLSTEECNNVINDMSTELYHMRISLKSLTNENTRIKTSNQLLSDRNALLETQFAEFEKMRVEYQVAKDDLLIVLKKEESIKAQLAKEHETITRWTDSKNVATNIIKKLDVDSLGDDTSTDSEHPLEGNASTDSKHPLMDNTSTEVTCPKKCTSIVSQERLEKLNKKYGPTSKHFVQGSSSKTKAENVNIGHLSNKQLKDRDESLEVKAEVKKKKRNGKGYMKNLWYLDSGCSRHMTGDSTLLTEFVEKAGPSITFGYDSKGFTKGYGLISKDNVIIDQVTLVDGLKHNLLSISQLCDKGYRKGNVYITDFNSTSSDSITCLLSKASKDESWLWHKRLSHLNFKSMNDLVRRDLVSGLPQLEFSKDGLCDSCQKGKQKKISFRSKLDSSIDQPLQLLHMDLFGPVNVMSISKKRYYLVIVDDFSKFTWTYFLHSKDGASEIIINHMKAANNHPDLKVEAVNTACFTQNISLVNQAKGMTPYQLLKGRKPSLNFLHVFGCKCFVLRNQGENLGKFESKADEATFVGYAAGKAYMVFNYRINIVMESVHVVFYDARIQGLTDEGFHETLRFENEVEGLYFDDEDDDHVDESVPPSMTISNMDNSSSNEPSIEGTIGASVGSQNGASVGSQIGASNDVASSRPAPTTRRKWTRDHPFGLIISDASANVQTRRATQDECLYSSFLSQEESKKVEDALLDPDWVLAMQEELNQF
ncbi:hypothetical protein POM88_035475 [Heracleum sosnowskyi]|uniref:GAG-pre-integrase domain-containing protein n=1 Tax=Heracleum sosnowskyi TaxID=360622 RepID=A0AAD8HMG2_9APIA|nr:hypothetical protein POM88_035475 [Heracleum sosnowskyi]